MSLKGTEPERQEKNERERERWREREREIDKILNCRKNQRCHSFVENRKLQ